MSQGEMIGRQGRKYVSIPLPQIDLPQFSLRHAPGRWASGRAMEMSGDPIAQGDGQSGQGEAGSEPGQHIIEVDVTLEETGADPRRGTAIAQHSAERQKKISSRRKTATPAFVASDRTRCDISSAHTAKRSKRQIFVG
jgi:hypothetical protein